LINKLTIFKEEGRGYVGVGRITPIKVNIAGSSLARNVGDKGVNGIDPLSGYF